MSSGHGSTPNGGPPNNWLDATGHPAWARDEASGQYYLHSFLASQPDLNWCQPAVHQAFHGTGCRPTRLWLFNRLKAAFAHVYVPRTQPAHAEFPSDWTAAAPADRMTRAVFVASRAPLALPTLLDHLPDHQPKV